MQKLAKRAATAERVALKRRAAAQRLQDKHEWRQATQQTKGAMADVSKDISRAKQAIRDDWNLGPLAPRTHIGTAQRKYGAVDTTRYSSPAPLSDKVKEARCAWLGGTENLNLVAGDRVVLLEGADHGKIGTVRVVNPEKCEVVVEGLNKSNVNYPLGDHLKGKPGAVTMEFALPISAVRLVHPIRDPETGVTRDVVIQQLRHSSSWSFDSVTGKSRPQRVIPGLNIIIPWPKTDPEKFTDHPSDTRRLEVEQKTFVPTLLRPPMPEGVIDELRNKYSRFRTRHEPAYIARKEAEEQAKLDRAKLMESMRTPMEEYVMAEGERKKRNGKPRLSLEMLEEIGRVIANNRERTLNASGLSDVSPASPPAAVADAPPAEDKDAPPPPSS